MSSDRTQEMEGEDKLTLQKDRSNSIETKNGATDHAVDKDGDRSATLDSQDRDRYVEDDSLKGKGTKEIVVILMKFYPFYLPHIPFLLLPLFLFLSSTLPSPSTPHIPSPFFPFPLLPFSSHLLS